MNDSKSLFQKHPQQVKRSEGQAKGPAPKKTAKPAPPWSNDDPDAVTTQDLGKETFATGAVDRNAPAAGP